MNFNEKSYTVPAGACPVPVILDTDTYNEIDDQFALVYALLTPECINLRGVTAAPFLNSRSTSAADGMEKSYREIVRIIDLMGFGGRVPAYRGATAFLPDRMTPVRSEAVDFIIAEAKRARGRCEKLFVVAIGAITNLASALLIAPDRRVKRFRRRVKTLDPAGFACRVEWNEGASAKAELLWGSF